ncbi:MAG: DEAD/DEAH box helicase [Bdellovibrionales bacterium]|nr:DEAD/DEAH box helicase [Bdellovibrionales bacterium]
MQQGEQVQLSSSDSSSENDSSSGKQASSLYENFLTSDKLRTSLKGQTGSALEVRLVQELAKDKNIVVEFDRDLPTPGSSVTLAVADKATDKAKTLIVTPTTADVERLLSECQKLPVEIALLDDEIHTPSGALAISAEATTIVASFDSAKECDLKARSISLVVFYGFSAGARIPGSDDFESFLEKLANQRLCFAAESVPLTLNAAITRHIRTEGFINVNLEKEQEVQLSHEYYEVGHELLAKPEALATLLETEAGIRAIVFCNSPSDTDLLEVMLKKKGLKAKKLIGNVPDRAIHTTMENVREGEISILVLTDVSGRGFPVEEFDIIVHYAAPEDPEIYLHRLGQPDGASRLKRVVSLVGSMDLGNFHFLKKVVEFDFQQRSLPSAEDIAKARFGRFQQDAVAFSTSDEELLEYAKLVEESDDRKAFILYLLNQALRKLPEAESAGGRSKGGRRDRDDRSRGDHRDHRDGRGSRGGDYEDEGRDYSDRGSSRHDKQDRHERPKPKPTRKDIRFYVGHGLANGLSEEKFVALVKETMGDEAPELKRSCLRDKYSFFDFEQAVADEVFDAMQEAQYEGESLVFQKAAILSVPLDEEEDSEGISADGESRFEEEQQDFDDNSEQDDENDSEQDVA